MESTVICGILMGDTFQYVFFCACKVTTKFEDDILKFHLRSRIRVVSFRRPGTQNIEQLHKHYAMSCHVVINFLQLLEQTKICHICQIIIGKYQILQNSMNTQKITEAGKFHSSAQNFAFRSIQMWSNC